MGLQINDLNTKYMVLDAKVIERNKQQKLRIDVNTLYYKFEKAENFKYLFSLED